MEIGGGADATVTAERHPGPRERGSPVDPDGGVRSFQYGRLNRISTAMDVGGSQTTYSYGKESRLAVRQGSRGTIATSSSIRAFLCLCLAVSGCTRPTRRMANSDFSGGAKEFYAAAHGDPAATDDLIRRNHFAARTAGTLINDTDPDVRWLAIFVLDRWGANGPAKAVAEHTADADPLVSAVATEYIADLHLREFEPLLVHMFRTESGMRSGRAAGAARALGALQDRAALPVLLSRVRPGERHILQSSILQAVGETGGPADVDRLLSYRRRLERYLGDLGPKSSSEEEQKHDLLKQVDDAITQLKHGRLGLGSGDPEEVVNLAAGS